MNNETIPRTLNLKAGEWVEVRSRPEILSTLDKNGRMEELPFMPQMLEFCGQKLQVHKHVHKLCGVDRPAGSRIQNAVNLEGVRCDGQAYGGCEMQCMILWKEAWLKRVDQSESGSTTHINDKPDNFTKTEILECSESDIWAGTQRKQSGAAEPVYQCQATQLPYATRPLSPWEPSQFIEDYVSGNASVSKILSGLLFRAYHEFLVISGLGVGSFFRWIFDVFQFIRGGLSYPWHRGQVPKNSRTPTASLNLQIGEVVRVKDYKEILKTLDEERKNRGLHFHAELSIHCGKTFRVLQRPKKVMDENTGHLMVLKNDCIVLDGADCEGRYTNPLNCTRATYPWYREIWLERVPKKECNRMDESGSSTLAK